MRYYKKYQPYSTLIGERISLPCNITPSTIDDDVSLILWYRDDQSTPIYTVDARGSGTSNNKNGYNLKTAKHFFDKIRFSSSNINSNNDNINDNNRITFNITYPISYLNFHYTIASDTAEYRCRVDFRRDRTINRVMKLNVIVPAKKLSIYDKNNNHINDIAGPFNEDSSLNLTCVSEGGYPLPTVTWWRGEQIIENNFGDKNDDDDDNDNMFIISDDTITTSKNSNNQKSNPLSIVKTVLHIRKLSRRHLMMPLTCESRNTNLTVPITKTILIDMNLKPLEVKIVRPLHNMIVGERIELICQSSGSRPPAKIQWYKNGKPMEHFSETTSDDGSVTTNYLAFIPTIDDNGERLSCVARNQKFKTFELHDSIRLDILYAPILSLLLGANAKQQEIIENSSIYFDCNIQANPSIEQFGWLFNGRELLNRKSINKFNRNHNNNNININVNITSRKRRTNSSMSTTTTTIASNTTTELLMSNNNSINVDDDYDFNDFNNDNYDDGDNDNDDENENNRRNYGLNNDPYDTDDPDGGADDNDEQKIEIRNNSIIIKNVQRKHFGQYQCWAQNRMGKSFSELVELNVKYSPICSSIGATEVNPNGTESNNEIIYELDLYEQLKIECSVDANPSDVIFFWEFNSSATSATSFAFNNDDDDDDDTNSANDKNNESILRPFMEIENFEQPSNRSILYYQPRTNEHYGTIYCFAQNRIGRQQKPCIYHIRKSETPIITPKNCSLQNLTPTSLMVHCHIAFSNNNRDPNRHSDYGGRNFHQKSVGTDHGKIINEQPHEHQKYHLSAINGNYRYILLIYNDHNELIENLTMKSLQQQSLKQSSTIIRFNVNSIKTEQLDDFKFYIYTVNEQNGGQSERIRIQSNNLVGQPKKLEHIEQFRLNNLRPFLLLIIFIVGCSTLSLSTFVIMMIIIRRKRLKHGLRSTNTKSNQSDNVGINDGSKDDQGHYPNGFRDDHHQQQQQQQPTSNNFEICPNASEMLLCNNDHITADSMNTTAAKIYDGTIAQDHIITGPSNNVDNATTGDKLLLILQHSNILNNDNNSNTTKHNGHDDDITDISNYFNDDNHNSNNNDVNTSSCTNTLIQQQQQQQCLNSLNTIQSSPSSTHRIIQSSPLKIGTNSIEMVTFMINNTDTDIDDGQTIINGQTLQRQQAMINDSDHHNQTLNHCPNPKTIIEYPIEYYEQTFQHPTTTTTAPPSTYSAITLPRCNNNRSMHPNHQQQQQRSIRSIINCYCQNMNNLNNNISSYTELTTNNDPYTFNNGNQSIRKQLNNVKALLLHNDDHHPNSHVKLCPSSTLFNGQQPNYNQNQDNNQSIEPNGTLEHFLYASKSLNNANNQDSLVMALSSSTTAEKATQSFAKMNNRQMNGQATLEQHPQPQQQQTSKSPTCTSTTKSTIKVRFVE